MSSKRKELPVIRRVAKGDLKTLRYTQTDFEQDRQVAERFFRATKGIFPRTPTQNRMQSSRG